jgi:SpoIIAA-like
MAMIAFDLHRDKGVLVVEPKGALTAKDFRDIAQAVDPYILENGKPSGLLIDAPAFPGWDSFGALVEHMNFVREHHRKIDRVAAVSDSAVLKIIPEIARHFANPEIRTFKCKDRSRALAWVATGVEEGAGSAPATSR